MQMNGIRIRLNNIEQQDRVRRKQMHHLVREKYSLKESIPQMRCKKAKCSSFGNAFIDIFATSEDDMFAAIFTHRKYILIITIKLCINLCKVQYFRENRKLHFRKNFEAKRSICHYCIYDLHCITIFECSACRLSVAFILAEFLLFDSACIHLAITVSHFVKD